jgi:prepilin-type N-terminal cleavage/methylation domain-containing protein
MTRFAKTLLPRDARKLSARRAAGFSLIELLCVITIMSVVMATTWTSIVGLISGNKLSNSVYDLSGLVRQAKTAAMTQNTYVWLGFYSTTLDGAPTVMVSTVYAKSGLATDIQSKNVLSLVRPVTFKNVALDQAKHYLTLPGVDVTDNNDAATQSNFTFTQNIPNQGIVTFSEVIVFSPDGSVNLPQADGSLSMVPCVGIGLNASPAKVSRTVGVQIHGLSGQVSIFQQ